MERKSANLPVICPVLTYYFNTAKLWNSAQHAASYTPRSCQQKENTTSYQFLSGTRLHVVGIRICVLQGVTTLWGSRRKREKKDKNLRLGSQHSHICVTTTSCLLTKDNQTLHAGISYTFLGRTCAVNFTKVTSRWFLASSFPRLEVLPQISTTPKFPFSLDAVNVTFWGVLSSVSYSLLCQTRHNYPPLQVVLQHFVGIASLSMFPSCS